MTRNELVKRYIKENHVVIILAAIFAFGIFLRFNDLTRQSYWLDELYSADFADPSKSIEAMFQQLQYDTHPPLYIILLRIVYQIFGYNEFTGRAFSAIIGSLGVLAIYYSAQELFNKHVGLYAAFISATNYFLIEYSQEARSYSIVVLCSVLSTTFFYKTFLEESRKNIICYLVSTIILFHIHYIGFFQVAAHIFFIGINAFKFPEKRKKIFISFIFAAIILVVFILPLMQNILMNSGRKDCYIQKNPSILFFAPYIYSYFQNKFLLILFAASGFFAVFSLFDKEKEISEKTRSSIALLLFCISAAYILPYLKGIFSAPMLGTTRYTITALPAIIILISYGLWRIDSWKKYIIIASIIIFSLHALIKYYDNITKGQYREIIKEIEKYHGVPVYSTIPSGPMFETNHYQTYAKLLRANINVFNVKHFKKNIDKLPECFWVLDAHFDLKNHDDYGRHIRELKLDDSFYRSVSINLVGATAVLFSSYSDRSVCSRKIGL